MFVLLGPSTASNGTAGPECERLRREYLFQLPDVKNQYLPGTETAAVEHLVPPNRPSIVR